MIKQLCLLFLALVMTDGVLKAQSILHHRQLSLKPVNALELQQQHLDQLLGKTEINWQGNFIGPPAPPSVSTSLNKTSQSNMTIQQLGQASNAYSIIENRANQVFALDRFNFVGFIHRQNIAQYGGSPPTTSNGVSRFDFSTRGGEKGNSWTIDAGPINPIPYPNAARARYPQAVPFVPANSPTFDSLRMVWISPTTDGNGWGNINRGVFRNLKAYQDIAARGNDMPSPELSKIPAALRPFIQHDFLSNAQDQKTFIPGGLCQGKPGEFWYVDNYLQNTGNDAGRILDSLGLFHGKMNATNTKVEWKRKMALKPNMFRNPKDGSFGLGQPVMAFSPDGQWGWIVCRGNLENSPRPEAVDTVNRIFEFNPFVYWTKDGGQTWEGPQEIILRNYSVVRDSLRRCSTVSGKTTCTTGIPFAGDYDIVVDKNGNPHIFIGLLNASREVPFTDSIYYVNPIPTLFDVTTTDNGKTWCPKFISGVLTYQGSLPGVNLRWNNYLQASRNEAGTHIFFSWIDHFYVPGQPVPDATEMKPDLFTRALRITDDAMTEVTSPSAEDNTFATKILYPQVSPTTLTKPNAPNEHYIPTVFMQITNNELQPVNFYYIADRVIKESDFKVSSVDLAISNISAPAEQVCYAERVPLSFTLRNVGTTPIKDSIIVRYSVNGGPFVREKITNNLPLAPGATLNYSFTKQADIAENGTYAFLISAEAFDDRNCSNSVQERRVINFGGRARSIFPNELTGCGSLTLNTGLSGLQHTWRLRSTGQEYLPGRNQSVITLNTVTENEEVTVEVRNPQCTAGAILTDKVAVKIFDAPKTTLVPLIQRCKKDGTFKVKATDNNNFNVKWVRMRNRTEVPMGNTNEITPDSSGRYIATVIDPRTRCEVKVESQINIFDVKAQLRRDTSLCWSNAPVLDASNGTTPEGVFFDWFITGRALVDTTGRNDVKGEERVYNNHRWFPENNRVSNMPYIYDSLGRPMKYKVIIRDPLGCSVSSDSVTIAIRDTVSARLKVTWPASVDSITNPLEFRVPAGTPITIQNVSKYTTPRTRTYWSLVGGGFEVTSGAAGGPNNFLGTNQITFRIRSNSLTQKVVNMIVQSGRCADTASVRFRAIAASSVINKLNDKIDMLVYPNPTQHNLTVELNHKTPTATRLSLFDLTGKMLIDETLPQTLRATKTLDISHLPTGVYLLKATSNDGYLSYRILKE